MEVIICSLEDKKIVNRGFLLGPYCPIYGLGGIVMLFLMPYKNEPLTCFVLAFVICSIIEYVTSYLMEKIFKVRWWDYSNDSFNINGRVCLRNAIAFGLLGMLCTRYVYPFLFDILDKVSSKSLIILCIIIFIVTIIDTIVSFKVMSAIKKTISKNINDWKERDATTDIKKMIRDTLVPKGYLQKRIVKAYHYFSYQYDGFLARIDDFKKKVKKHNTGFSYGTICGVLSTIILSFMTKDYEVWFSILVPLGFFIDIIIYTIRRKNND